MSWRGAATCLVLACALSAGHARGAEPEKRALPDYDGRGRPQTPGQKALWVPRVLLSPLYFVSEYLVRRPLGYAITAAEKAELPGALYDFFAFGPDHKAGIVPITLLDFGFEPSVGLYAFWDDAGFQGHDLRLRGSTWGSANVKSGLGGALGLGILASARTVNGFIQNPKDALGVAFDATARHLTFYTVAAWDQEPVGLRSGAEFQKSLDELATRLDTPIEIVNLEKTTGS